MLATILYQMRHDVLEITRKDLGPEADLTALSPVQNFFGWLHCTSPLQKFLNFSELEDN